MWRADVVSCGSEPSTVVWCSPVYTGFMWMLLLVAYGQKDPNAFLLKQHIRTSFDPAISQSMSLSDVFQWANTSLLSNLFGNYPGKKKNKSIFFFHHSWPSASFLLWDQASASVLPHSVLKLSLESEKFFMECQLSSSISVRPLLTNY